MAKPSAKARLQGIERYREQILSQPLAELTRAAGGPSLQLSVPVIAAAGYCLLGASVPRAGGFDDKAAAQEAHAGALVGKAGQRT